MVSVPPRCQTERASGGVGTLGGGKSRKAAAEAHRSSEVVVLARRRFVTLRCKQVRLQLLLPVPLARGPRARPAATGDDDLLPTAAVAPMLSACEVEGKHILTRAADHWHFLHARMCYRPCRVRLQGAISHLLLLLASTQEFIRRRWVMMFQH